MNPELSTRTALRFRTSQSSDSVLRSETTEAADETGGGAGNAGRGFVGTSAGEADEAVRSAAWSRR